MIEGLTDSEREDLILSVGTHRRTRRLTPIGVARLLEKATWAGVPQDELAGELGLASGAMCGRFQKLLQLPEELQLMVDWGGSGTLSMSQAHEIGRLREDDKMLALAACVIENGLTSQETKQVVQRILRGKVDVAVAVDEIVRMRPVVERLAVVDLRFRGKLEQLQGSERSGILQELLREASVDDYTSCKLGVSRCLAVGPVGFGGGLTADQLESLVDDALDKKFGHAST